MVKGALKTKGTIYTQIAPLKQGGYLLMGRDEHRLLNLGTYQSLQAARKAAEPFDGSLDIINETLRENRGVGVADPDDIEQQRQRIRSELARKGYKLLHRRKGQYWVMMGQPMTLDQIEQILAKL